MQAVAWKLKSSVKIVKSQANKRGSSDIRMKIEMKPQCIEGVVYLKNMT